MFGASLLYGWGDTARSIPLTEVAPLCFWRGVLIPVRDLGGGGGTEGLVGAPLAVTPSPAPPGAPRCEEEGRKRLGWGRGGSGGWDAARGGGGRCRKEGVDRKKKKKRKGKCT